MEGKKEMEIDYAVGQCSKFLDGLAKGDGRMLRPGWPVLSVFLGEEALRQREIVERVYSRNWGQAARNICSSKAAARLEAGWLSQWVTERQAANAGAPELFLAIFWDVADSNFEDSFAALNAGSSGIRPLVFAFLPERGGADYAERLGSLMVWAVTQNQKVFFFGARKPGGSSADICKEERFAESIQGSKGSSVDICRENFEIAAKVVLTIAMEMPSAGQSSVGAEVNAAGRSRAFAGETITSVRGNEAVAKAFGSRNLLGNLFCAFSREAKKDTRQMAAASLAGILACCQGTGGDAGNVYAQLVENAFAECLQNWLPEDDRFFASLPRTGEMEHLYQYAASPSRGIFRLAIGRGSGRRIERAKLELLGEKAKESVAPFWREIKKRYYVGPLEAFFTREGEEELRGVLRRELIARLGLGRLSAAAFLAEAKRLANIGEAEVREVLLQEDLRWKGDEGLRQKEGEGFRQKEGESFWQKEGVGLRRGEGEGLEERGKASKTGEATTVEEWFGEKMLREVKLQFYPRLFRILSDEMKVVYAKACEVKVNIDRKMEALKSMVPDATVWKAYRELFRQICRERGVFPARYLSLPEEDGILPMAVDVFQSLAANVQEFRYPLGRELLWRKMQTPGRAAHDSVYVGQKDPKGTVTREDIWQMTRSRGRAIDLARPCELQRRYCLVREEDAPYMDVSLGTVVSLPAVTGLEILEIACISPEDVVL